MSDIKPEWVEAGYLMWCFSEGYGLPEDRPSENWLLEPDERLHPDDVRLKAQLIALGRDLIDAVSPLVREAVANEISSEITATSIPDMRNYGPVGAADWMRTKAADIAFRIGEGND